MTVAACRIDRSRETGSLVVCACGLALGPFTDHARAVQVAREHRAIENRARDNARQRERRATGD